MDIIFKNELEFAREFWSQAIIGLEEAEYPPKPDEWLENGKQLTKNWECTKFDMIKTINTLTDETEKKQLQSFMSCTLCLYIDLMCALSKMKEQDIEKIEKNDKESIESFIFKLDESEEEELTDSSNELPQNEQRIEVITSKSGLPNITV
jgi:hypothetical protein